MPNLTPQRELALARNDLDKALDRINRALAIETQAAHSATADSAELQKEVARLRAENESLRAEYDTDHQLLTSVIYKLQAKHERLVAAARAFERDFAPPEHEVTVSCFELRAALANEPETETVNSCPTHTGNYMHDASCGVCRENVKTEARAAYDAAVGELLDLTARVLFPDRAERIRELRAKAGVV